MRALLTPEIAPRMGIVLFRPGSELMPLFMQGRVLLEPEPERYSSFASGAVPAASQPLADDPAVRAVLPMIDRGDIRQAIDRCSNIWASLPGAGYGQYEHKIGDLIARFKEAGGVINEVEL
ncbi:TPA: hypothetical protein HGR42_22075 [Escherichia coli]|nr:hypothetical protein [Escherichia coli]HAG8375379.1 hypothetical protein [Escherichia coli]